MTDVQLVPIDDVPVLELKKLRIARWRPPAGHAISLGRPIRCATRIHGPFPPTHDSAR